MSEIAATNQKISLVEYIIMFLIICISGNPLFIYTESKYVYAFSMILILILCITRGKKISSQSLFFWVISSISLFICQNILLEHTSINAELNFITRLYTAFLTASIFGYRFREVYFKVMVAICAISLPLFLLNTVGLGFGYEHDRYQTVLFYNSIKTSVYNHTSRNSGMFWEPGAFQGFIMLVFLFYSNNLRQFWNNYRKESVILLLALLTTKSTTAYLVFGIFLFGIVLLNKKQNVFLKVFFLMLLITMSFYAMSLEFMGDKIAMQYEEAMSIQKGDVSWNRMGAMVIDIDNIKRHPIIGNGFMDRSRYGILGEYMRGTGNGFTGAINMFGIPFIIMYLIAVYKNQTYIPKERRLLFVFVISLLLTGEYFLNYPFFWSLLFVKIPNTDEKNVAGIHYSIKN